MTVEYSPGLGTALPEASRTLRRAYERPGALALAAVGLAVLLAVPFFLVDVPPVLDYPNHLARLLILAHPDTPGLSSMYAPHWALLPNLGADVIGMLLLKLAAVHVGGRLLLALALFAPVLGVNLYSRVAFGHWSWWALGSAVTAYNGVFLMGFMSFLISVGLAFAGAAVWLVLRRRGGFWLSGIVGAAMMALVFLCHLFGVALMGLLIGAQELEGLLGLWRLKGRPPYGEAARRAARLGLVLAPTLILFLSCGVAGSAAAPHGWDVRHKVWDLFTPFMSYDKNLTLLIGIIVLAVIILGWRGARFATGARLALALCAAVYALEPDALKTGSFVDLRVGLILGLVLFAGVQPRIAPRYALACGLVMTALIGAQTGAIAYRWADHRSDLADVRGAIAPIAQGARVLVARGGPPQGSGAAPAERLLPGVYQTDSHIAALVAIERRAFWPLIFADPRQQPLVIRPPYAAIADPQADPVSWAVLAKPSYNASDLAAASYLNGWRKAFDYVLLIDAEGAGPPPPGLQLLYAGSYARLYRTPRRT